MPKNNFFRPASAFASAVLFLVVLFQANTASGAERVSVYMTEIPGVTMLDEQTPGSSLEVTRAVFREANIEIEEKFVPWNRAVNQVGLNPNSVILPFSRTSSREDHFVWIFEYAPVDFGFISFGERIDSIEEARKLDRIGVWQGTAMEQDLVDFGLTNMVKGSSDLALSRMLTNGRIDAWYDSMDSASYRLSGLRESGGKPIQFGKPIKSETVWLSGGVGFPPELAERIRAAYEKLKKNGTVSAIYDSYRQ